MKKVLRYLQNQAAAVSDPPIGRPHNFGSGGSEPSDYILLRIEENATKPGEVQPASGLGDLAHVCALDKHQATANAAIAAGLEKHQYAYDSILQGYDVYIPEPPRITIEEEKKRLWVVYIHGGYWCDPQQLAWTFTATRAMLLTHPSLKNIADLIAGYASLNYRLSRHSNFPQNKCKTSDYEMRDAKHPDHVNDVLKAIRDLQRRHGFEGRYLLLGHGCGATLAMQVAMSRRWTRSGPQSDAISDETDDDNVIPPIGILGIDGIYDIPLFRNKNTGLSIYQTLIEGAFGNNEQEWAAASPANWSNYAESWKEGRLVILAHSREDELVDWSQVESMERCWSKRQEWENSEGVAVEMRILEIQGNHAEIWQKGVGMAGPIREAVLLLNEGLREIDD